MGEMIEFAANGGTARGYVAAPAAGTGPAIMVIQEWWGLAPQIKTVCDQLAEVGYVALAPDLYDGELAEHDEMDKASHLSSTLDMEQAAVEMSGAITALLDLEQTSSSTVGIVGYCMGGMLSLVMAAKEGDRVAAVATFYGAPVGEGGPDWSGLTAAVEGHFAETDDFFPPDQVKALETDLRGMGKNVTFTVYPGTGHAFTNEDDPLGTYNPELDRMTWGSMLALFEGAL
ncbi:MAG: carboxymethylenebutenolidase [Verrucomicrobiales bacterium]|jgi:carboxymethylenebutenolidase